MDIIIFLGYVVSAKGIEMDEAKVKDLHAKIEKKKWTICTQG